MSGGTTFASGGTIYTTDSTRWFTPEVAIIVLGFLALSSARGAVEVPGRRVRRASDRLATVAVVRRERLGAPVWLAILVGVLLTIGFILIVIPGIFLLVAWVLACRS